MDFKKERQSITIAHHVLKYAVEHFHAQGYDVNDEWYVFNLKYSQEWPNITEVINNNQ